jgi:DNA-binding transcriptional LysR family regulator
MINDENSHLCTFIISFIEDNMIENMETFIQVVQQKSFAKAARKLGISTPMVTRKVVKLEQELGVMLLQRSTRHLSLTEAGEQFYSHCIEILDRLAAAKQAAQGQQQELTGVIKIGLPASISSLYVVPALADFVSAYPQLSIQIVHGNHFQDLLAQGFDVVVYCGRAPDSSFLYKKLATWHKVTCAAPSYLQQHGMPRHPTELEQHNCMDHYDNYLDGWAYQIDGKQIMQPISGHLSVNSSLDLQQLAMAGLGIVYLPSFAVQHALNSNKLLPILTEFTMPALEILAIYPNRHRNSKKLAVTLAFLAQCLQLPGHSGVI